LFDRFLERFAHDNTLALHPVGISYSLRGLRPYRRGAGSLKHQSYFYQNPATNRVRFGARRCVPTLLAGAVVAHAVRPDRDSRGVYEGESAAFRESSSGTGVADFGRAACLKIVLLRASTRGVPQEGECSKGRGRSPTYHRGPFEPRAVSPPFRL